MEDKSKKTITLRSFTYLHEAHLAKAELESNGINAFVQDQHLIGMNLWYSQAIGGVKLQVLEHDMIAAEQVLDQAIQSTQSEYNDKCPKCGSVNIRYFRERKWKQRSFFSLISFFLLGFPWIFQSNSYLCKHCGYCGKYRDLDDSRA